jgi:hypothetical protein
MHLIHSFSNEKGTAQINLAVIDQKTAGSKCSVPSLPNPNVCDATHAKDKPPLTKSKTPIV